LLWLAVNDFALCIEHVGSTSVPGPAAKPIVDIDLVIPFQERLDSYIDGKTEFILAILAQIWSGQQSPRLFIARPTANVR
jgi:GrpB-like predicted nucleotidyltransferase (UPF0157 family)